MAFPGSEGMVEAAEASLGRRLSEPHRGRLIRENGGEVRAARQVWTLYPVQDATDRHTVGRTANHIVRENESLRRNASELLPIEYIAIADNGGGDLLVIGRGGDATLIWDHETRIATPAEVAWGGRAGGRTAMGQANVRATMENGDVWDDPSEDLLFDLLSDIEAGDEAFIVIERLSDESGQTYAQSTTTEDGWLVEHRDGAADRHFRVDVVEMREAHEILTAWAFDLDDWRTTVPWRTVRL